MKYLKIPIVLLLALLTTHCTDASLLFLNTIARFGNYTSYKNIAYGENSNQKLDIYIPQNISTIESSNVATVVFFYGGCWGACSHLVKEDYQFIAQTLTKNNIITIIVDYRKYPAVLFPDIIKDAASSVEWVNKNIETYKGNSNNLYLMGHSAGAHLASMLTFNENYLNNTTYKNIKGFIGLAGAYDFLPFDEPYQPALFAPPADYPKSQTINYINGTEPPSLLLYGNDDKRVKRRNILSLEKGIKHKKGTVVTHFYDGIDHTSIISALSIPFRASKPILNDILVFIRSTVIT